MASPAGRPIWPAALDELDNVGCTLLQSALGMAPIEKLLQSVEEFIESPNRQQSASIKSRRGDTYAARNLMDRMPLVRTIWQTPELIEFLTEVLGHEFGLVRGLYFDKHPDRTWSLGWHKDMTIAVKDNAVIRENGPREGFSKPTRKAGIPHVEASQALLQQMVTLRIHLDQVTESNGPLEVIPGSHRTKETESSERPIRKILAGAGDVLAMRPLIVHASGSSHPGADAHRRIVHLEFSGQSSLPAGLEWYHFERPQIV